MKDSLIGLFQKLISLKLMISSSFQKTTSYIFSLIITTWYTETIYICQVFSDDTQFFSQGLYSTKLAIV